MARLKTDGSMDTTFGSSGTTKLGAGRLWSTPTHGSSVLIQPDGKILVTGWNGPACKTTVMRYLANGALDSSFGSGGTAQADCAGRSVQAQDVALTADGHIVVVGISKNGSKADTTVLRFTSSGQPDTTFPSSTHTGNVSFDVGNGLDDFRRRSRLTQPGASSSPATCRPPRCRPMSCA